MKTFWKKIINHEASLKQKWALATGVGVLVIVSLFTVLLFYRFSGVLLQQERTQVGNTLTAVTTRINTNNQLTSDSVEGALAFQDQRPNQQKNWYTDSLATNLVRHDVTLEVYNANSKRLFTSRKNNVVKFNPVKQQKVTTIKNGNQSILVGRQPLINRTGQIVGYVQVIDKLDSYHNTVRQVASLTAVLIILAVLIAALFGYILTAWLLRPINEIRNTMNEIKKTPDADIRVPSIKSHDELAALGNLFNDMLDQMQRYIDQQQQFVEDVSHELRTPVAVIQGHMEMLLRWGKDDPEILTESLTASLQETKRMQSLVAEMLDLSRAEQIEVNYGEEVTDVSELVNQVYNDFKMIHPDFVITLDNDVNSDLFVKIYRNHLEQVLIILLDNAVKYSETRKEIHVSLSKTQTMVNIAVQDFGEGIAADDLQKVFDRFYRVDKARSRNKGGNGLGLSIAARLIDAYHGKISIESSPGYGSIFQIELPIDQQH
ncbi:HAMP domain-containing histidine kinase [Lentilactobacillus senioris]|uniref:HAMP domain-containing sensor histidine kinase n=1 Tax=Lentilactobacillus senioris TaxID=931534 RepID=UPI0022808C2D|nr:HAMP domain-containing histidine kinase [Lentilactobacillus senioris]MCY9806943.1 HAMP domain-containing histidine kinase [Lentilactobacillus senioris]